MTVSFVFALLVLALLALVPVFWTWRFIAYYCRRIGPVGPPAGDLPRVTVILPLRGADPSLAPCLSGLLRQDYPHYAVHIVVDSQEDPAWEKVRELLALDRPRPVDVRVDFLKHRRPTCSLKVSAQLQAVAELDERTAVAILLDADSVPAPDWLRAMVAPLADPHVGACTGVRWYAPAEPGWGNLVRHLYNAGSFTQMFAFHIAWGGSLALRTELFRRSDLLERWSRCLCEDSAVYGVLRPLGLQLAFVPAATQINRESIDLAGAYRFILRQLLCVRLHHVHWRLLLAANLANALVLTVMAVLLGVGLALPRWEWALAGGGVLAAYIGGMLAGLTVGEYLIRRNAGYRQADVPAVLWTWRMIPAAVLTQVLSVHCLLAIITLRRIEWRGALYAIGGCDRIRLLEYRPLAPAPQVPDQSRSVL